MQGKINMKVNLLREDVTVSETMGTPGICNDTWVKKNLSNIKNDGKKFICFYNGMVPSGCKNESGVTCKPPPPPPVLDPPPVPDIKKSKINTDTGFLIREIICNGIETIPGSTATPAHTCIWIGNSTFCEII